MSALKKKVENDEQRTAPRERVMLTGNLSYLNGKFSMSCLVVQISTTGARLSVDGDVALPEKLQLTIPQRGIDCPARFVWRRGRQVGVVFEDYCGPLTENSPQQHARDLEAENLRLRALLAKLEARLKDRQEGY